MPLAIRTILLTLLVVASAAPVAAQDELSDEERSAMARGQFEQGVRATAAGQWQRAADAFGRALELRESPQIRYNLAESLFRLGRLVEASEHVAILERERELPPAVARSLADLSQRVERAIGHLTVVVEGSAREDVDVTVDGRPLPAAVWGVETAVDPGRHVVRLRRGGEELQTEEALVPEGGSARVELIAPDVPPPSEVARAAVAEPPPAGPGEQSDGGDGAWWPWLAAGVGAAAAVVILIVLVAGSGADPTPGDFDPGVLEVR